MVILNGQEISEEEFKKIQEKLQNSTNEKIVEIAPNTYKILSKIYG